MIKPEDVAVLLVSMDNRAYLDRCIRSLLCHTSGVDYHIYLVNTGKARSCDWVVHPDVTVLEADDDTSWVGGLVVGARHTHAPYLLFLNDDVLIPPADPLWLRRLVERMDDPAVGAVGPCSNVVSGPQSLLEMDVPLVYVARYLISFCCLVRATALENSGGLDPALTDADDLDYSIRLRRAGYTLVGDRGVYVHHHGFVTGTRLHGPREKAGGYNSPDWAARNLDLLRRKHGAGVFGELYPQGMPPPYVPPPAAPGPFLG